MRALKNEEVFRRYLKTSHNNLKHLRRALKHIVIIA